MCSTYVETAESSTEVPRTLSEAVGARGSRAERGAPPASSATLLRASEVGRGAPVHGRPTPVHHDGRGVFAGLPQPLRACRYHSLYVQAALPAALRATAHSDAGEVMAVQHQDHPTHGVQFHPESFRTEHGERLLENFLRESAA